MMEILAKSGIEPIANDAEAVTGSIKGTQPVFHEHTVLKGKVTRDKLCSLELYRKPAAQCLKVMITPLIEATSLSPELFGSIVVMYRDWRAHSLSWTEYHRQQTRESSAVRALGLSGAACETFVDHFTYPPGVIYAEQYSRLVCDAFEKGYVNKLTFVCFSDIVKGNLPTALAAVVTPSAVLESVDQSLGNRHESRNVPGALPDAKAPDTANFWELKPGFFAYMDQLNARMASGDIDSDFVVEAKKWIDVTTVAIVNQSGMAMKKYGLSVKPRE
jgi:hypothetical protein